MLGDFVIIAVAGVLSGLVLMGILHGQWMNIALPHGVGTLGNGLAWGGVGFGGFIAFLDLVAVLLIKCKKSGKEQSVIEYTIAFPDFESLESTREKIETIVRECTKILKSIGASELPYHAGDDLRILNQFLTDTSQDWDAYSQYPIRQACAGYCNHFNFKIEEHNNKAANPHLLSLIKKYRSIFCEPNPEIQFERDWLYFPSINMPNDPLASENRKRDFAQLSKALQTPSNTTLASQKKLVNNHLAHEYKIHLMPDEEHVFEMVHQLLDVISKNPQLKSSIVSFKVSRHPTTQIDGWGGVPPVIVIYLQPGKEKAQTALNLLVGSLKKCFEWGTGTCPRYNRPGENGLIFYAQGDGSSKSELKKQQPEVFSRMYEPDGVHFNVSFGKFALTLPTAY